MFQKLNDSRYFPLFVALILNLMISRPLDAGSANSIKESGPLPVNPQERSFFQYLTKITNIRFADGLQTSPWVTCEDNGSRSTFFSASILQFAETDEVQKKIRVWVESLFDHAYWANVDSATCTYDINHFNECFSKGEFKIYFKNNRVISFLEKTGRKWCL